MPVRAVSMVGDGYVPLFPLEKTAYYLAIYASVVSVGSVDYLNFRHPVPKSFYGYYQLFDDQAVVKDEALSFRSQLLWKNVDNLQLNFIRFCQLGDYVREINSGLGAGFSASFSSVGVSLSPSFPPPFDAFERPLVSENPTGLAFKLEPDCFGEIFIVSEYLLGGDCLQDVATGLSPGGCGGQGNPPTEIPPGCLPFPPGGGGST